MLYKFGGRIVCKALNIGRRLASTTAPNTMSTGESTGFSLSKIITVLEDFAPNSLSEKWDNTGLLVQPYTPRNVSKILLTNDLTEDVALEAKEAGCELIISYHPPIFAPLKSIVQSSWKERVVSLLLESGISLYSPHTSWDCVRGGVNDWLASVFNAGDSKPIIPGVDPETGAGRRLLLKSPISLTEAVQKVKEITGLKHVRLAVGKGRHLTSDVEVVALCAGSGGSVLKGQKADLYLTGEMLHHDILDAVQNGISVVLTNHSDSERGFLPEFSKIIRRRLDDQVVIITSTTDKDPLITV